MKNILIIDTAFPINTRTQRFKKTLEKDYSVYTCAWARDKDAALKSSGILNYFIYMANIGYGKQLKKMLYLPLFSFFSLRAAIKVKPRIVFASHWDSLLCAVLIKLFFCGKPKIIYDCLDMPTTSNSLLHKGLIKIERLCLKLVDLTIFASRYFKELYPRKIENLVFENYPSKNILDGGNSIPSWFDEKEMDFYKNKKSLAWIGVVRYFDVLENILKAIRDTDYLFYVFGDGPDLSCLKDKVEEMEMGDQVFFFGRYAPSDLKFIYDISGLVWAAYPTKDLNAVYAISNKYFECSYFNKVPIISRATKMAHSLKGSPSVILLDEYSVVDIKRKILEVDAFSFNGFVKYEPDVLWEEKEDEFLSCIKAKLCV